VKTHSVAHDYTASDTIFDLVEGKECLGGLLVLIVHSDLVFTPVEEAQRDGNYEKVCQKYKECVGCINWLGKRWGQGDDHPHRVVAVGLHEGRDGSHD